MPFTMLRWVKRYHAYLAAKGAATPPLSRYVGVQMIAMPWLLPLVGVLVWGISFNPPDHLRTPVIVAVMMPAAGGMIYAMLVYVIAGIRQDMRENAGK